MQIRIGNHLLTSHRPESLKARFPNDKDARQMALVAAGPDLVPLPRTQWPLQMRRLTPYLRYPTVAAVNQALYARQVTATPGELVAGLRAHLAAHRRAHGAPTLVVQGEEHGKPSSLMATLVLIHDLARLPGPKRLLVEESPAFIAQNYGPQGDPGLPWLARRIAADRPFNLGATDSTTSNTYAAILYARHLGFEVSGYDPAQRTAASKEERENAMAASVACAMPDAAVTLVITGTNHVPMFHERFAPVTSLMTTSALPAVIRGDHDQARSASYLLATPRIDVWRPTAELDALPAALDAAGNRQAPTFDIVHFINHVL